MYFKITVYSCFQTPFLSSMYRFLCWPLLSYIGIASSPIYYATSIWMATRDRVSPVTSWILQIAEIKGKKNPQTEYGANQRTSLCDKGNFQTQKFGKWFATSSKKTRSILTMKAEHKTSWMTTWLWHKETVLWKSGFSAGLETVGTICSNRDQSAIKFQ